MRAEPLRELEARDLELAPAPGVESAAAGAQHQAEQRSGHLADRGVLFEQQVREVPLAARSQAWEKLLLLERKMARHLVFQRAGDLREQRAPRRIAGRRDAREADESVLEALQQVEDGDVLFVQFPGDLALRNHVSRATRCTFPAAALASPRTRGS